MFACRHAHAQFLQLSTEKPTLRDRFTSAAARLVGARPGAQLSTAAREEFTSRIEDLEKFKADTEERLADHADRIAQLEHKSKDDEEARERIARRLCATLTRHAHRPPSNPPARTPAPPRLAFCPLLAAAARAGGRTRPPTSR